MQHNLNSGSGKTDAEIRADNAKRFLGEVRMSNDLRWHDKLSPKQRRRAFFWIGYIVGVVCVTLLSILWALIKGTL